MSAKKTLDFYIRRAWLKIHNMYNQEAESRGYSISSAFVLLNIDRNEGTPSTQLGPLMGLQKASLSRMLKSMEEDGIIYRKMDPEDQRIRRVYLTELGEYYRTTAREVVINFQSMIDDEFEPEKLAVFYEVLNGITDMADKQRRAFDRRKNHISKSVDS